MSDVYVTDTAKALEEADSLFANILTELQDEYSEKWNTVCCEVTDILKQYTTLLEERDKLLVEFKELEDEYLQSRGY